MKELMVHVERVVRPVRALESRKDRMREELLAHLTSIFEEELARSGDRDIALREALRRFGDPAALTCELQVTAPRQEWFGAALERWFRRRRGEAALRFTLRLAGLVAAYCVIVFGIVVTMALLLEGPSRDLATRLRLGVLFLLFVHASVISLALLYLKLRAALCDTPRVSRSWLRAAGWSLLSGLVVPVFGWATVFLTLGDLSISLGLLYLWYPFAVLIPASLIGLALYGGPAQLRHAEWINLDLAEGI